MTAAYRAGGRPRVPAAVMRLGARQLGTRCLNPSLDWPVQRARLDRLTRATVVPRGTKVSEQSIGGVPAEVVSADGADADRVVLHFHGGGYCVGSARTPRAWAAHLGVRATCRVVLPLYRLAPEHPYPAALDDAQAVMKALSAQVGPDSIVVSGDSAGGGLALALVLRMRDEDQRLPAGCVLLSPWLDLGRDRRADPALVRHDVLLSPQWLEACARAYADPSAWTDPAVSPLLASHSGLPPLLIQAGGRELLAPDAELLAASAAAAGVNVTYTNWPRMWHDFALQPGMLAAADSALAQTAWFVGGVTQGTTLYKATTSKLTITLVGRSRTTSSPGTALRRPNSAARSAPIYLAPIAVAVASRSAGSHTRGRQPDSAMCILMTDSKS